MAKKKAFALRIDEDLMTAVEIWAANEFRSANGQIEFIIYQALRDAGRLPNKSQTEKGDDKNSE